jgi:hypothetical protein
VRTEWDRRAATRLGTKDGKPYGERPERRVRHALRDAWPQLFDDAREAFRVIRFKELGSAMWTNSECWAIEEGIRAGLRHAAKNDPRKTQPCEPEGKP